ncbi:MAG: HEAT repeat domain-containing protein [Bauldia sp.]
MSPARLLSAAGASALLLAAGQAAAIEFNDLDLPRPEGVAGLMYDDRLCFPETWLAFEGINMLGTTSPERLWLLPLALIGEAVEAGGDPPPAVIADQMRAAFLEDPAEVARANVEFGVVQTEGYLTFLDCIKAVDPAVYQLYRDVDAGTATDIEGTVRRFTLAEGDRQEELAAELGEGGAAAAVAMIPVLADPAFRGPDQTSALLLIVRAFGRIGPDAAPAATELVTLLGDARGPLRAAVRQSLTRIGPAAVPAIITALTAEAANARFDAALVLSMIDPPPVEAVPALQPLLNDPDENVREIAQRALDRIAPPPPPAPEPVAPAAAPEAAPAPAPTPP